MCSFNGRHGQIKNFLSGLFVLNIFKTVSDSFLCSWLFSFSFSHVITSVMRQNLLLIGSYVQTYDLCLTSYSLGVLRFSCLCWWSSIKFMDIRKGSLQILRSYKILQNKCCDRTCLKVSTLSDSSFLCVIIWFDLICHWLTVI